MVADSVYEGGMDPTCLTISLLDNSGDRDWHNFTYELATYPGGQVVASGPSRKPDTGFLLEEVCNVVPGCYTLTSFAGSKPDQISWSIPELGESGTVPETAFLGVGGHLCNVYNLPTCYSTCLPVGSAASYRTCDVLSSLLGTPCAACSRSDATSGSSACLSHACSVDSCHIPEGFSTTPATWTVTLTVLLQHVTLKTVVDDTGNQIASALKDAFGLAPGAVSIKKHTWPNATEARPVTSTPVVEGDIRVRRALQVFTSPSTVLLPSAASSSSSSSSPVDFFSFTADMVYSKEKDAQGIVSSNAEDYRAELNEALRTMVPELAMSEILQMTTVSRESVSVDMLNALGSSAEYGVSSSSSTLSTGKIACIALVVLTAVVLIIVSVIKRRRAKTQNNDKIPPHHPYVDSHRSQRQYSEESLGRSSFTLFKEASFCRKPRLDDMPVRRGESQRIASQRNLQLTKQDSGVRMSDWPETVKEHKNEDGDEEEGQQTEKRSGAVQEGGGDGGGASGSAVAPGSGSARTFSRRGLFGIKKSVSFNKVSAVKCAIEDNGGGDGGGDGGSGVRGGGGVVAGVALAVAHSFVYEPSIYSSASEAAHRRTNAVERSRNKSGGARREKDRGRGRRGKGDGNNYNRNGGSDGNGGGGCGRSGGGCRGSADHRRDVVELAATEIASDTSTTYDDDMAPPPDRLKEFVR